MPSLRLTELARRTVKRNIRDKELRCSLCGQKGGLRLVEEPAQLVVGGTVTVQVVVIRCVHCGHLHLVDTAVHVPSEVAFEEFKRRRRLSSA